MQLLSVTAAVVFFAASEIRLAAPPPVTAHNPKPAEHDVIVPRPNWAEMVFRKIMVPGKNFWADPVRVVQIGDGEGGIFEGLQRVQVSGSFPDEAGTGWSYYLGKYEVTKAQYVAVMGLEALLQASGDSAENARLAELSGKALEKALAKPLVFVSWQVIQDFTHDLNLWLFDPRFPERLQALPQLDAAPGFIRLPTEIEWEYAARGGYPAIEAETFKNRLPFARQKLPKHAWYLENAKHKVRPIGLRAANMLGLHDMLGNAQELTTGLFRPEIWQGKPGGLTARGGSVATPAQDMRSSRREEVEIYKWVEDERVMREWSSYNTGLRLAIGSNVVITPANRKRLERDYARYRDDIRGGMPVGRTLDNYVAQAATQLSDARINLSEIMDQNQHLKSELSRIRSDIENAEQRLDFALRESARSSAQDALREATDLGRDLFKLESFYRRLTDVERLAELSTRYQDLVTTLSEQIAQREDYAQQLMSRYSEDVGRLGEYGASYIDQALETLRGRNLTKRAVAGLDLLTKHVAEYQKTRRLEQEQWREDFQTTFKDLAD